MKKSLKNIIKENKSTFENEQVPGFVWDHIENELHPEKKRRGGWKLWTGMGLSAAAATALVFVLIKPSNEEYVYHEEQKHGSRGRDARP